MHEWNLLLRSKSPIVVVYCHSPPLLSLSLSLLVLFLKNSKKKTYLKCPLKEKKKITKSDNNPRDEIDKKNAEHNLGSEM